MADIRPKDLLPTAESPAADDFLLLDGPTQGTRKMLAAGLPVSVMQFGAKGDGVTNDAPAFNAAIRRALEVGADTGGVATVPALIDGQFARYRLDEPVLVPRAAQLISEQTDIDFNPTDPWIGPVLNASGDFPCVRVVGPGARVRGFALATWGDATNPATGGIFIDGSAATGGNKLNMPGISIEHIRDASTFYNMIHANCEIDDARFSRIFQFLRQEHAFMYLTVDPAASPSNGVLIENCHSNADTYAGRQMFNFFLGGLANSTIRGCVAASGSVGIYADIADGPSFTGLTVDGCHFEERRTQVRNAGRWSASASISAGAYIKPTKANANGWVYVADNSGTTGGTEPTWTTAGGELGTETDIADGTVTWVPWSRSVDIWAASATAGGLLDIRKSTHSGRIAMLLERNCGINATGIIMLEPADIALRKVMQTQFSQWHILNSSLWGNCQPVDGGIQAYVLSAGNTFRGDDVGVLQSGRDVVQFTHPKVFLSGLSTTDPVTPGRVWSDGGALKLSLG